MHLTELMSLQRRSKVSPHSPAGFNSNLTASVVFPARVLQQNLQCDTRRLCTHNVAALAKEGVLMVLRLRGTMEMSETTRSEQPSRAPVCSPYLRCLCRFSFIQGIVVQS